MNEPQEFHAAPRRRARLTIFFTILLDLIGFGMIVPFLTFYAQEFHATPLLIGLLFSSYSLTQLLCAPLLGRLSDRLGRRPVLLASIAGSVVAYALFAAAPNYAVLLLARALAGVAAANYAIAQAYLADITPPEGRAKAMGLVGAAFGIGFVLGPALGGLLAHAGSLTPALAGLGPRIVPVAAGLLAAVNLAFAAASLPESLSPELRRQARAPQGLLARRHRAARGLARLAAARPDAPLLPGDVLLRDHGDHPRPLLPGPLRLRRPRDLVALRLRGGGAGHRAGGPDRPAGPALRRAPHDPRRASC